MEEKRAINGIDIEQWRMRMEPVRGDLEQGKYRFRAKNKWVSGMHSHTEIKDFYAAGKEDTSRTKTFVIEADEPMSLLGTDYGPNATEAVLHALAACLNASFISQAALQGIEIEELEFELEGEINLGGLLGVREDVRIGYESICVKCKVKADVPKEKLEELFKLAQERSPVYDIVTNKVPVEVKLEIEQLVKG